MIRTVLIAVLALSLAALSGCGGTGETAGTGASTTVAADGTSSTANGSGSDGAASESVAAQALAVGREYARCARSNGEAGFPDPQLGQNGTVSFPGADKTAMGHVEGPCGAILRRLPPPQLPPPTAGQLGAMRSFSACMRSHPASPDYPDPNADGTFPTRGTRYDYQAPTWPTALQAAWDACWHFTSDAGGWRPFQS